MLINQLRAANTRLYSPKNHSQEAVRELQGVGENHGKAKAGQEALEAGRQRVDPPVSVHGGAGHVGLTNGV